ncbi:MAG: aminopeptidase N [Desulfobacteraceae bacterium]|nr:aminopeptidase N [Desulfobacteraceae bacterium]
MKTHNKIYLKDYVPPNFLIDHIDLTFELTNDYTQVTSLLQVVKNKDVANDATSLVFDKGDFKISSVIANGMVLLPDEYEAGKDYFKLMKTPDEFTLEITSILYPEKNTSLEGLYKSGDIFCTQCEAQGFRRITPFPDRPDVMATYTCTIIADKDQYPFLLSNGNLVKSGDLDKNRHFVTWQDPFKKPSYLFALVAGDLVRIEDTFTTCSGKKIDLHVYVEKENQDKCDHAMQSLKQAMKWDEKRFSLEYDLDLYMIVAINDFNAGAMENKGLNIFNSKAVLADSKTATDDDFLYIQSVVAHEYFHNWTGNRVTLRNWFQLSLKEGLTVFRDQEFSSDLNSRGVKRISDVKKMRLYQFPEDDGPMTHPVRPESYIKMDNFYTMTVYDKGSEVIGMIHQILGEDLFMKGMALYFDRFDGMAVTIEDFVKAMEDASSKDLTQFKLWYSQSGTPTITLERKYDAKTQTLSITVRQATSPDRNQQVKKPLHIPLRFGIVDRDGNDITPQNAELLELKTDEEIFEFKNIPLGALPSICRQFSAPVKISADYTDDDLAFLMAHDTDEFNRWDACQTLLFKEIKSIVGQIEHKKTLQVSAHLIQAFQKALGDEKADKAFLAKTLIIPNETEIKDHFDIINVTAIHKAHKFLEKTIALKLKDEFMDIIKKCESDPLSISAKDMANRNLKNLALSYVGALGLPDGIDIVMEHYETARNMTDELAGFRILLNINEGVKLKAVEKFYNKWRQDKLVLDKWFAAQAASSLPDTLEKVRALTHHPDFSIKNPNKVRSLFNMFAMFNQIHFHDKEGLGYAFIADQILEVDALNQMVAARLAGCFNHFKKYDEKRKALMKYELERIISHESLSKNVYEIVSRALE